MRRARDTTRSCHSLGAAAYHSENEYSRGEVSRRQKAGASTSCVEANRLNPLASFSSVAETVGRSVGWSDGRTDGRTVGDGRSDRPFRAEANCPVVFCAAPRFGTTLNFGRLGCFSRNFQDRENLGIKDIPYFSTEGKGTLL